MYIPTKLQTPIVVIKKFGEFVELLCRTLPDKDEIIYISFVIYDVVGPFMVTIHKLCFIVANIQISEARCESCTHCGTCGLEVELAIEVEDVMFENKFDTVGDEGFLAIGHSWIII